MKKASKYFITAIVALTLILGSMAMAPAARSDASIYLKSGVFVPAQVQAEQGSRRYFVVQFTGPVEQAWKDAVSAEGAEILAYIPDFAFKVNESQQFQISQSWTPKQKGQFTIETFVWQSMDDATPLSATQIQNILVK